MNFRKREPRQAVAPDYGYVDVSTRFESTPPPFDETLLAGLPETATLVMAFDASDDQHYASLVCRCNS